MLTQRPKHTAAHGRSSHLPLLESIDCAVTTIETPVSSYTSSCHCHHLEAVGTRQSSNLRPPSLEFLADDL
jgi:hypothetical protein